MKTAEEQLKRLKIRSWRRGTKEMDLILGSFFDEKGAHLSEAQLLAYEALLNENDHDIYAWVSQKMAAPEEHIAIINDIRRFKIT